MAPRYGSELFMTPGGIDAKVDVGYVIYQPYCGLPVEVGMKKNAEEQTITLLEPRFTPSCFDIYGGYGGEVRFAPDSTENGRKLMIDSGEGLLIDVREGHGLVLRKVNRAAGCFGKVIVWDGDGFSEASDGEEMPEDKYTFLASPQTGLVAIFPTRMLKNDQFVRDLARRTCPTSS